MKHMHLKRFVPLLLALVALTRLSAETLLFGLSLGSANSSFDDSANLNGIHWNRTPTNGTSPSLGDLIHPDTGAATGIAFSTFNAGGFFRNQDSLPNGPITYDNIRFPTEVVANGVADNFASGRDGLMVFRFVIPESLVDQNAFKINSVLGSNNTTQSFEFNVGGTWGGTSNRTFTGGTTISAAGSTSDYTFVTLSNAGAVYDAVAETYTLDLQYGYTGGGTSGVVAVRGITVSVIPEPGTLALLGIAIGSLLLFRRRK